MVPAIKTVRIWARFNPKSKPFFEYISKIAPKSQHSPPRGIRLAHPYLRENMNPMVPDMKPRMVESLKYIAARTVPYKQEFFPPAVPRDNLVSASVKFIPTEVAENRTIPLSNQIAWWNRNSPIITSKKKMDTREKRLTVVLADAVDSEQVREAIGSAEPPAVEIDGFLVGDGLIQDAEFVPFATPETVIARTPEEIAASEQKRASRKSHSE